MQDSAVAARTLRRSEVAAKVPEDFASAPPIALVATVGEARLGPEYGPVDFKRRDRLVPLQVQEVLAGDGVADNSSVTLRMPGELQAGGEWRKTVSEDDVAFAAGDRVLLAVLAGNDYYELYNGQASFTLSGDEIMDTARNNQVVRKVESLTLPQVREMISRYRSRR